MKLQKNYVAPRVQKIEFECEMPILAGSGMGGNLEQMTKTQGTGWAN